MDVLIIGNNHCNNFICDYFSIKGVSVTLIEDVFHLRTINGEMGNFIAHTKDKNSNKLNFDFVLITQQPFSNPSEIAGLPVLSLFDAESDSATPATIADSITPAQNVVLLLDHTCESPMSSTIYALNSAIRFAKNKRTVYYLAKFIRTAGRGIEALYRQAREAGVIFIKYEDLQVSADITGEDFVIKTSDGALENDIKTKIIYADGGMDVGERFEYISNKLNLTPHKYGRLTEDTYYLTPALTSRFGVYHITRDLAAECLNDGLDYIYAQMNNGTRDIPSLGSAVIDEKKCIFCYNCYRACPHAALGPAPGASRMQCLSIACAGCGICASLCPAGAITLENEDVEAFFTQHSIDNNENISCDITDEDIQNDFNTDPGSYRASRCNNSNNTLILYCENSGGALIEKIHDDNSFEVDVLSFPCGGMIETQKLSDSLYLYEKIMVISCPDDSCRHFNGSLRACAQAEKITSLLTSGGINSGKIRFAQISQAMPGILKDELQSFNDV